MMTYRGLLMGASSSFITPANSTCSRREPPISMTRNAVNLRRVWRIEEVVHRFAAALVSRRSGSAVAKCQTLATLSGSATTLRLTAMLYASLHQCKARINRF